MNIVTLASIVIFTAVVMGVLLATLIAAFSRSVSQNQVSMAEEQTAYNLALTVGHKIPVEANFKDQLAAAQVEAARRAAALPRGANALVGRGNKEVHTAFDGVNDDPVTAVYIASQHGWQFLRTGGAAAGQPVAAAKAPTQTAPAMKSASDLVPGADYPFIEITDDMEPAEIRKARIANSKAKSAAIKALKDAGVAAAPAAAAPVAAAAVSAPAATPVGAVSAPVAGIDYPVIEITDDMDPADVRKARIANSKAKSAAMKKFKESGGVAGQAAPAAAPIPAATSAPGPSEQPVQVAAQPADIPPPEYIEITDDMAPDEIRKARIANSKAKSAYNKALKAAGIDPKSLNS